MSFPVLWVISYSMTK